MGILVGRPAPEFTARAMVNRQAQDVMLSVYRNKSYVVLFFYPANFTSICNSELLAFQQRSADFTRRGTELLACSVDDLASHENWLKVPAEQGGIAGITFPLLSDESRALARNYDVIGPDNRILRGLFIIDKQGVVRHQSVNEDAIGRSVDETLRTLDAVQHVDQHGRMCPANWKPGVNSMTSKITQILKKQ